MARLTLPPWQRHLTPALRHSAGQQRGGFVTDRIYLAMAGLFALAIVADVVLNNSDSSLFLIRKLFHLVDYLEFWR